MTEFTLLPCAGWQGLADLLSLEFGRSDSGSCTDTLLDIVASVISESLCGVSTVKTLLCSSSSIFFGYATEIWTVEVGGESDEGDGGGERGEGDEIGIGKVVTIVGWLSISSVSDASSICVATRRIDSIMKFTASVGKGYSLATGFEISTPEKNDLLPSRKACSRSSLLVRIANWPLRRNLACASSSIIAFTVLSRCLFECDG